MHVTDAIDATVRDVTNGHYFHLDFDDPGQLQPVFDKLGISDRYPLFPGNQLSYAIVFVQPGNFTGGAHIDDPSGGTYFYLRLLEGRKKIRLFPDYEHGELQKWGCAQRRWHKKSVPPELFLRGTYS